MTIANTWYQRRCSCDRSGRPRPLHEEVEAIRCHGPQLEVVVRRSAEASTRGNQGGLGGDQEKIHRALRLRQPALHQDCCGREGS
jgi:hypothetical protein